MDTQTKTHKMAKTSHFAYVTTIRNLFDIQVSLWPKMNLINLHMLCLCWIFCSVRLGYFSRFFLLCSFSKNQKKSKKTKKITGIFFSCYFDICSFLRRILRFVSYVLGQYKCTNCEPIIIMSYRINFSSTKKKGAFRYLIFGDDNKPVTLCHLLHWLSAICPSRIDHSILGIVNRLHIDHWAWASI